MKKVKKLIPLFLILLAVCAAGTVKVLIGAMNSSLEENGRISVNAVLEQIQQAYEQQVGGFYNRLRVVDDYMVNGKSGVLDNADLVAFLHSWQNETKAKIFFIKDNGAALTVDKEETRLELSSVLLKDLKEKKNIARLIRYNDGAETKSGFIMAVPCEEYYIGSEAYTAIGAVVDRSEIDSMLQLYAYGGAANIFALDTEGNVIYANQTDEKLFQNYSLLKHLRNDGELTEEQFSFLQREIREQHSGISVIGGEKACYLGYYPIESNNAMLVCIVPKNAVDNTLIEYQKIVMTILLIMTVVVLTLFAGLFFAVAKVSIERQKALSEEQSRIRQQKNMEDLEALNKELKEAQGVTAEALQAAENANKAKTNFLSTMSHDIRTPMNAIIGITALLENDADNADKVREYVRKIKISAQNLFGIINDVLDMNKIESGKTTLSYTDFSLSGLIREIEVLFRPQAEEKNQTLEIVTENIRHDRLTGDNVRLTQIFGNLLSNAVKYTQKGGKILFYVEEHPALSSAYAKYRFIVKDNGMGMDEGFKDRIFEAFTREESSLTNKIQGTGLGMAITRNLIEIMGGTIDVESKKGEGSCFEIMLDMKLAKNREALPDNNSAEERYDGILHGMRFLCAEDNELNSEILTELLKLEGAECTIYENGEKVVEAFEKSEPGDYDMILMDVQMPVMNGYEATKKIRSSSHALAKTIPIIAMTANAFSEDIQLSLNAGMNAHVSKPVDMNVLKKTIQNIRFGGGGRRDGQLTIDN